MPSWDVVTDNLINDRESLTLPETLPLVDNMNQLPICGIPGDKHWDMNVYSVEKNNRIYHFSNEVDKWIFECYPEQYEGHKSIIDRFLGGEIQPMTLEGALKYMGFEGDAEIGRDAHNYSWIDKSFGEFKKAI